MRLSIDWRQYRLELKSGGTEVQAPPSWVSGVAPSISEDARTFLIACSGANLQREWSVVYGSQFDRDEVNRYLGFAPCPHRKWERRPGSSGQLGLGPLGEASLVVSLAV